MSDYITIRNQKFRYYQLEADDSIYNELQINNKCLVKMFCGTGKSLLMRYGKITQNKNLVVYVFPTLGLIRQFYEDYLGDFPNENILKISSANDSNDKGYKNTSTTDASQIREFLAKSEHKIICVTYQSYKTLLDNLVGYKIDICNYDEAHHCVSEKIQEFIFNDTFCDKQIFFTATPKNDNGIVMYDRNNIESGMCGKLVYDYSYFKGMSEGYLNPFEIRIDLYTDNTNKSIYESISRSIIESGNNRVLTFHADVNGDRDASVKKFVNEKLFKKVFKKICKKEFPEKKNYYRKIEMIGLYSEINPKKRGKILEKLDETPNNKIYIISSCETIGEGIDTKNANMCVFVDPKSSFIKIIQNIGRILRKQFRVDKPKSTILIPCWVDKTKYLECGGDKEKCDEVIRQYMNKEGDFNGIINVVSALKQEDEDLYEICLYYPDTFSPKELKNNLEQQEYKIIDQVGDGTLVETLENLLDTEIDYEECETDEEMIMQIAKDKDVCIEIHTNSLENPVERYNDTCKTGEIIRLYKSEDEETNEVLYQPIVKKCGSKKNKDTVSVPDKNKRTNIKVHTNPDVKVLWNIVNDFDITKDICSCVIDCEVIDTWFDRFEELKNYIDDKKKRPSDRLPIGKWLQHQRENFEKTNFIEKYKERYNLWKVFMEQNKEYFTTKEDEWFKNFEELNKYVDFEKKRPSSHSKNEKERQLGQWFSTHNDKYKNKIGGMSDEKRYNLWTQFLEKFKEYFITYEDEWYKNFKEVNEFIEKNSRKPSRSSDNEKEKFYGSWINSSKINYKKKIQDMKDINRYDLWTQFLEKFKEYFIINEDEWYKKFKEVNEFIDDKKRKPSKSSKNEEEKKLGNWIYTQLQNLKKNSKTMKDETKFKIWSEFLKENNIYFEGQYNLDIYSETSTKSNKNLIIEESDDEKEFILDKKKKGLIIEEEYTFIPKKSMKLAKNSTNSKKESTEQKRERVKSEISVLHQRYKTLKSENLHMEFNEQPELWRKYHEISEENEMSFPEEDIPRNRIIQELNKIGVKRTKMVVDMGCGKAQVAQHFQNDKRFKFINYDHISSNEFVESCDISKIPLEDESVEICILSLAMWGPNCKEYIKEAHRVLESGGKLYIIEATKRWSEKDENGNNIEGKEGDKLKTFIKENGFEIVKSSVEKFCLFVCTKM